MDCGEEISGGLVVACGNGPELLELAVEILDEVSRLVKLCVMGALDFAVAFGWDHRRFSGCVQRLYDAFVGVECFVCQQSGGFHLRQQRIGAFQIMGLAWREQERERIAKGVDQGMNFGTQTAFAAPNRLIFAVFFLAPALC